MTGFDQEKIDSVFEFLQNEFPDCSITVTPQLDFWGFNFTLLCDNNLYHLTINESFLADHDTEQITKRFRIYNLPLLFSGKTNHRFIVRANGEIKDDGNIYESSK